MIFLLYLSIPIGIDPVEMNGALGSIVGELGRGDGHTLFFPLSRIITCVMGGAVDNYHPQLHEVLKK
jgi:hypothetical protein